MGLLDLLFPGAAQPDATSPLARMLQVGGPDNPFDPHADLMAPPQEAPRALPSRSPMIDALLGNDPRLRAAAGSAGVMGAQSGDAVRQWLGDVVSGRIAANGLANLNDIFARTRSADPAERRQALIDLAGTFNFAAPIRAYHGTQVIPTLNNQSSTPKLN